MKVATLFHTACNSICSLINAKMDEIHVNGVRKPVGHVNVPSQSFVEDLEISTLPNESRRDGYICKKGIG